MNIYSSSEGFGGGLSKRWEAMSPGTMLKGINAYPQGCNILCHAWTTHFL